ncbi:hypothetical protein LB505_002112 [Fusarium chuoi]|nr:hypothetical protein LB505_002112 [Fusarium chuoi]
MIIENLQKEFVEQIVFRAIQCNAIYEDRYLLGTALARPVIARAQVRVAEKYNCNLLSHGCTGKGLNSVENRWIGLKSRGCYDTPGLTIARLAHVDLEGLVLDSKVRKLRDQFVTIEWSQCLYNGMYFSPEREWLDEAIVSAQKGVNGQVRLRAYKGNVYVLGRSSETSSLYSQEDASMDSLDTFSPMDSTGFIAIQSIRLEKYGAQKAKDGQPLSQS